MLARLGHIPTAPGETVEVPAFSAEVVEVTGHAITKVRLRPRSGEPAKFGDDVRQPTDQVGSNP